MKSDYLVDNYDRFWLRGETERGHYKDTSRAKINNAILDLAEDIKTLTMEIKKTNEIAVYDCEERIKWIINTLAEKELVEKRRNK